MYNDFILIGPKSDPAGAKGKDIVAALKAIKAKARAVHLARRPLRHACGRARALESRRHRHRRSDKGPWYREIGQGMGAALNTASASNAYVLADRGTWLSFKNRGDLAIVVEGDNRLFNQYGVILVNPAKHAHVKKDLGQAFIDWLVSPEGQKAIADYKIDGAAAVLPQRHRAGGVMHARAVAIAAGWRCMTAPAIAADPVLLHAAGSLRAALTEVSKAFETAAGVGAGEIRASGLLKDEIAGGAQGRGVRLRQHGASAGARRGESSGPVVLFARNRLCALVRPGLAVEPATLLDRMLDPQIKLATSTPRADPAGDYAWEVFRKAERIRPGAFAALEKKALQLVGGPIEPDRRRAGRSAYGALVAEGKADIFLTYCTNALAAQKENPGQQIVALPDALAVGADYGLTVTTKASPAAYRFAMFMLSPEGQQYSRRATGSLRRTLPQ